MLQASAGLSAEIAGSGGPVITLSLIDTVLIRPMHGHHHVLVGWNSAVQANVCPHRGFLCEPESKLVLREHATAFQH